MKPEWFYDEIYQQNFYVIKNANKKIVQNFLKKQFKWSTEIMVIDQTHAQTILTPGYQIVFAWYKKPDFTTVVHEATHAALDVFNLRKISILDNSDNEAFCYYMGWLSNKLLNCLNKRN